MFAKPFKVKANNAMKNSERKTLAQRIENTFSASAEDIKQLIPNKSSASYVKITTHAGHPIGVVTIDNVPMAFEGFDRLYPTIYTLWKIPNLLPTITVHAAILSKLQAGVPLYLPGVTIPVHGVGFPQFRQGDMIAVNTDDNSAAVIVGHAMMGSGDMLLKASGVCLETIHILGDALCKEGKFARVDRPKMGPASYSHNGNSNEDISSRLTQLSLAKPKEDWPSLGGPKPEWPSLGPKPSSPEDKPQTIIIQPETIEETEIDDIVEDVETPDSINNVEDINIDIPTDMDALLKFCLLSFMKLEGKRIELPLKTNLLYRNHMVRLCPDDRVLDVKKSTYKKMGKFMDAMEKEGLLLCKEIEKGVDALTGIELAHPDVRSHTIPPHVITRIEQEATANAEATAPCVKEMFSITANVVDLFLPLRKGSMLTSQEVRSMLTDYVKRNNLQDGNNRKMILPNPTISKVTDRSAPVSWEELMKGVLGKMTCCTEMRFPDGSSKVTKSKMEPIKIHMEKRSGNKMVTIVSNLEVFGLNLATLSKECQHGLSVACSITRLSSSKTDQLMIQGVQAHFIIDLLTEKYGLPKKYIEGVEEHLKKKRRLN